MLTSNVLKCAYICMSTHTHTHMNAFTHASYIHTHELLSAVVSLLWSTNMGPRSELAYVGEHNLVTADNEGTIAFSLPVRPLPGPL